jgi:hypothetical protein
MTNATLLNDLTYGDVSRVANVYSPELATQSWNNVASINAVDEVAQKVNQLITSASLKKEKEKVPKATTNILFTEGNSVKVKNCKDGEVKDTKTIMSDIKDIEVKYNGENSTVIFVTFKDGKTEKAVLDKDDEFSLEHGLTIIILEKLLSDKGVDGKSVHNKLVDRAMKLYNKLEKEKNDKAKKELEEKERKKRLEAKQRAKKRKQSAAEREYQIEIQKEAYLRAMREIKTDNAKHS